MKRRRAFELNRLDADQMDRVKLAGEFEQNIVVVLLPPPWSEGSPRGVLCRNLQLVRMQFLVIEPAGHMVYVAAFGERLAKQRFKLDGERRPVDRFGFLRRHAACSFLEDESTFHREQRRQGEVALLQCSKLSADVKQFAYEVFQVRRYLKNQLGMLLFFNGFRILPGGDQTLRRDGSASARRSRNTESNRTRASRRYRSSKVNPNASV